MGYRTDYYLSVQADCPRETIEKIDRFMETVDGGGWEFFGDAWWCSSTWYEQNQDMCRLSKAFPDVLFCLHGDGEESDDLWEDWWQNGKYQHCYAVIPPHDPEQMITYKEPSPIHQNITADITLECNTEDFL